MGKKKVMTNKRKAEKLKNKRRQKQWKK